MRSIFCITGFGIAAALSISAMAIAPDSTADGTLTRTGQIVPVFQVKTLEGQSVSSATARGRVLVLDFFATWCGPCMAEMPDLQSKVFDVFKSDPAVVVLAIGREHTEDDLRAFQKTHPTLTLPMAADPTRAAYSRFATEYIPRTYVIGPDGTILYQAMGYTVGGPSNEWSEIVTAIRKGLAARSPATRPSAN